MICWVLAIEMLQGVWKQHLRPRAVVGYGLNIFLPRPPNYVTRSPGTTHEEICWQGQVTQKILHHLNHHYAKTITWHKTLATHFYSLSLRPTATFAYKPDRNAPISTHHLHFQTTNRLNLQPWLDSEDDFRSRCWDLSRYQQSISRLLSPGRSNSIEVFKVNCPLGISEGNKGLFWLEIKSLLHCFYDKN